jgi:hypothetical protein
VTAILLPNPEPQFCDANGHPYAGGTIETYTPGTTTPKLTWSNAGQTAQNTNPIILDAAGRCVMYGDGNYRLVLRDASGNLVWDQPSSTVISAAMFPVVSAPTIADANNLLGTSTLVNNEAAARAAADSAEANARIAADNAEATARANADDAEFNARIFADNAEATTRNNSDVALANAIAALTGVPNTKSGAATIPFTAGGHVHITFPSAFPTACTAMLCTSSSSAWVGGGYVSLTFIVTGLTVSGADVYCYAAGSPSEYVTQDIPFYWIATGS